MISQFFQNRYNHLKVHSLPQASHSTISETVNIRYLKGPSADFFDFMNFSTRSDEILIKHWYFCCEFTLRLLSNVRAAVLNLRYEKVRGGSTKHPK